MDRYEMFLREEMLPAFGCTEPIAIALGAAKASDLLEAEPKKILVRCSGNVIKNAKSVIVPNSGGGKGIQISSALGAFSGGADKGLEVLNGVSAKEREKAWEMVEAGDVTVEHAAGIIGLYIDTTVYDDAGHSGRVVLQREHTNVVREEKDAEVIFSKEENSEDVSGLPDFSFDAIYDYATTVDYARYQDILDREISFNLAIGEEGLQNEWGAGIGRALYREGTQEAQEIAYAAAGSDARMSGCKMPVVINSGSGNQGMTVSLPVIRRAKNIGATEDELYRALIFANLIAGYQKSYIGRLSAYCGAISAGAASVAGIAFLEKQPKTVIAETLMNALATNAGVICDGAKPSCAAKIALSLRMSYAAYDQAKEGRSFHTGDGLVGRDVDATIRSIGRVAHDGMAETDRVILDEMLHQ